MANMTKLIHGWHSIATGCNFLYLLVMVGDAAVNLYRFEWFYCGVRGGVLLRKQAIGVEKVQC